MAAASPYAIRSLAAAAAWPAVALLLSACAGDKPEPSRTIDPALPMAQPAPESEKGQGNLSFHYANKSTDANLAIDLSSTDVYLEMTGKAAQEQTERMREAEAKAAPPSRKAQARPAAEAKAAEADAPEAGPAEDGEAGAPEAEAAKPPVPGNKGAKGLHKGPPKKPEAQPEEDPADYEDVTSKVLAGIRRAQELFYQKRYPEALQAARSSLDARPTAEGYALLGSIYYMQGNAGMARRQWLEALRLNPDMPAVVNMLEKTRTPGGRGSPSPRPVYHPPARSAEPEAPYPEEYSAPAPEAAPASGPAVPAQAVPAPAPRTSAAAGHPADDEEDAETAAPAPEEAEPAAPMRSEAPKAAAPAASPKAAPAEAVRPSPSGQAPASPGTAPAPAAAPDAKAPPKAKSEPAKPAPARAPEGKR